MVASPVLLGALFGLVILLVAIPVVVMVAAMRGGPGLPRIVAVVAVLAILIAGGWAVLVVAAAVADPMTVTVPISQVALIVPDGATLSGLRATMQNGGYDRVTVTATGFPLVTRAVIAASAVLLAATAITVAGVALRLVRGMAAGEPFTLESRVLVATGWVVLIGGTASTWVGNVGAWLASRDLFSHAGSSCAGEDCAYWTWPDAAFPQIDFPWAPVVIGLALALLAGIFRYGERLRHDTEGLV